MSPSGAEQALSVAVREAGTRVLAALAARFRDLDLAEEGFADACAAAAEAWALQGAPANPAAWLYRTAERRVLDALRRRQVRRRLVPPEPEPPPSAEDVMSDDAALIPDERLRLIFVCCHPAVAPEARAALTLRMVCGLTTGEIARAFLVPEPTLAQRLVRAKRKIAEAGVPFEIPPPEHWAERLEAVLTTLEIAYAKAHEDAAGAGAHAGYASEMLELTRVLAELLPEEADVLAYAALVRFAEGRRPARLDEAGAMVPLSEQDPALWDARLIAAAEAYLKRAAAAGVGRRVLQAAVHAAWSGRRSVVDPPPWRTVLRLYDAVLAFADTPIVRLNRAVALAEVEGVEAGLAAVEALEAAPFADYGPYHVTRADLLRRAGRDRAARAAYARALELAPGPAERLWLQRMAGRLP